MNSINMRDSVHETYINNTYTKTYLYKQQQLNTEKKTGRNVHKKFTKTDKYTQIYLDGM